MTLKTPIGEQTKTIKAGLELFQRLLINKKAEYVNLEEILCYVLSNTAVLLLVLRENPFPVTINWTWLQSGYSLATVWKYSFKIKSRQQIHLHAFAFRMAVNMM